MSDIKDSGERRTFESGAQRDRAYGKGKFKLFPAISYFFISRIFEDGAKKYNDRNWEKGMGISEFVDSAERHIQKYKAGLRDEPHLSMAGWNIVCALWTAAMVTMGARPRTLFDLPNHTPFDNPKPLSSYESQALEDFMGLGNGALAMAPTTPTAQGTGLRPVPPAVAPGAVTEIPDKCGYGSTTIARGPVHQHSNGSWWFYNETWSDEHGPYKTREEAALKLQHYAAKL